MSNSDDRPRLEGHIAEFRDALEAEINAARADRRGGIGLANGKRVSQRAAAFQYVFRAESLLNFPPDTPGDLLVGAAHHDATLISVEGLAVTLSVPSDLGDFVPEARLQTDLTFLLRKLIDRIETSSGQPNPAGDRMLGREPVAGEPQDFDDHDFDGDRLNPGQVAAVASALGRDTTFIWGPPGTRKTTTIGKIGTMLLGRRETALVVSHTNVAVDQAVISIAKAMDDDELEEGRLLRIGQPMDPHVPEKTLVSYHVERRSQELEDQLAQAEARQAALAAEIPRLEHRLDVVTWLPDATAELAEMRTHLRTLETLEGEVEDLAEKLAHAKLSETQNRALLSVARAALEAEGRISVDGEAADALKAELFVAEQASVRLVDELSAAENLRERAIEIEPARQNAARLPTFSALQERVSGAAALVSSLESQRAKSSRHLAAETEVLEETRNANGLVRRLRRLPSPDHQTAVVGGLAGTVARLASDLDSATAALGDANRAEEERALLDAQLRAAISIPSLDQQEAACAAAHQAVGENRKLIEERSADLGARETRLEKDRRIVGAFQAAQGPDPATTVLAKAQEKIGQIESLRAECARAQDEGVRLSEQLANWQKDVLSSLIGAGFVERPGEQSLHGSTEAIEDGRSRAVSVLAGESAESLREQHQAATAEYGVLARDVARLRVALTEIEEQVIRDADAIATTLTRAYLRDSVQSRRFGTVILDEASMAPIPALWIAARLADRGLVLVGDFRQLPPIVLSSDTTAEEWLGKDIFEKAGIKDQYERHEPPEYFMPLTVQHRMHPSIANIPRSLFYDGHLTDAPDLDPSAGISEWLDDTWGNDVPVLLVDTGTADAWVTSVPRGRSTSRLNFLSATISVDLAKRLLKPNRPPADPTRHRVLIISPYRPHANLVQALIKDDGLSDEILAGTAHSFQGSEADLVILDLVNDEPHWRVAMFTPDFDDTTTRLLNVAVTRTRARLIVIGDFDYIEKSSRRAFMGRKFVPFLQENYPLVDALDIVPSGLTARAAQAASLVRSDDLSPERARSIVTQDVFFEELEQDIAAAVDRLVIYSPFMTKNRLSEIGLHLRAAADRGVRVYVVTKPREERKVRERAEYVAIEETLRTWGITVAHKKGMHEKVVLVDDEILWTGSLNPLSQARSQEIMERRSSRQVANEYGRVLRTQELLDAYDQDFTKCPACQSEIVAAEGRDEPYFWRCINDDCKLSRSIDDPPLTDEIRCQRCGGPVEFQKRTNGFAWRCEKNHRHWQRIRKTHLRLPKVRESLTAQQMRELNRAFGLTAQKRPERGSEQLPLSLEGDPNPDAGGSEGAPDPPPLAPQNPTKKSRSNRTRSTHRAPSARCPRLPQVAVVTQSG